MKTIRNIMTAILAMCMAGYGRAQECEVPIAIYIEEQLEEVPAAAQSVLENSLTRLAAASEMNTDFRFTDFILTARIDVLDKHILPGPPMQISRTLGITLYLANAATQTKFSSAYLEVSGVGTNDTKCMTDAFRRLNAGQADIKQMMTSGRKKMLAYYDKNYRNILQDAERKAALQQYEEAIALAISIPTCSQGGDEATTVGLSIYAKYRDKTNRSLLDKAKGIWAAGQDQQSATAACGLLAQIDSDAACYNEAVILATEIKKQIRRDIDFEMRQKYDDSVKLEEAKIEAMRAIGVAYGKGQQPRTTHLNWLK